MKKQNKKQSKATKTEAQKSVSYELDKKQNHSMRRTCEQNGADAFILHAFDKISSAYIAACIALYALGKAIVGESVTLVCNGVTERIDFDKATGNYSRKVGNGKVIFGNVTLLTQLYGAASVYTLADSEIASRYAAQKEMSRRKLGDGRTIEGRTIATGKKGDMLLEVFAVDLGNGKFALHNLEDKTNSHQRKVNRFALLQDVSKATKTTKGAKTETAATK